MVDARELIFILAMFLIDGSFSTASNATSSFSQTFNVISISSIPSLSPSAGSSSSAPSKSISSNFSPINSIVLTVSSQNINLTMTPRTNSHSSVAGSFPVSNNVASSNGIVSMKTSSLAFIATPSISINSLDTSLLQSLTAGINSRTTSSIMALASTTKQMNLSSETVGLVDNFASSIMLNSSSSAVSEPMEENSSSRMQPITPSTTAARTHSSIFPSLTFSTRSPSTLLTTTSLSLGDFSSVSKVTTNSITLGKNSSNIAMVTDNYFSSNFVLRPSVTEMNTNISLNGTSVTMTSSITPSLSSNMTTAISQGSSSSLIKPSPTPLVNQTSITQSHQISIKTDDIALVSSMYPCYITYIITHTVNQSTPSVPSSMNIFTTKESPVTSVAMETHTAITTSVAFETSPKISPSKSQSSQLTMTTLKKVNSSSMVIMKTASLLVPTVAMSISKRGHSNSAGSAPTTASSLSTNDSYAMPSTVSMSPSKSQQQTVRQSVVNITNSSTVLHGSSSIMDSNVSRSRVSIGHESMPTIQSSSQVFAYFPPSSTNVAVTATVYKSVTSVSSPVVVPLPSLNASVTSSKSASSGNSMSILLSMYPSSSSVAVAASRNVNNSSSQSPRQSISSQVSPSVTVSSVSESSITKTPPLLSSSVDSALSNASSFSHSPSTVISAIASQSISVPTAKRRRRRAAVDPGNSTLVVETSAFSPSYALSSSSDISRDSSSMTSEMQTSLNVLHASSSSDTSPSLTVQESTGKSSSILPTPALNAPSTVSSSTSLVYNRLSSSQATVSGNAVASSNSEGVILPTTSATETTIVTPSFTTEEKVTMLTPTLSLSVNSTATPEEDSTSFFARTSSVTTSVVPTTSTVSMGNGSSLSSTQTSASVGDALTASHIPSSAAPLSVIVAMLTSSFANRMNVSRSPVSVNLYPSSSLVDNTVTSHSLSFFTPVTDSAVHLSASTTLQIYSRATEIISTSTHSTVATNTAVSSQPTPAINATRAHSSSFVNSLSESTQSTSSTRVIFLITTSSLGMCYVVYSTRKVPSSSPSPSEVLNVTSSSYSLLVNSSSVRYIYSTATVLSKSSVKPSLTVSYTSSSVIVEPTRTTLVEANSTLIQLSSATVVLNVSSSFKLETASASLNLTPDTSQPSSTVVSNSTIVTMATSVPVSMGTSYQMANSTVVQSSSQIPFSETVMASKIITSLSLASLSTAVSRTTSSITSSILSSLTVRPTSVVIAPTKTLSVVMVSSIVTTTTAPPITAPPSNVLVEIAVEIPRSDNISSPTVVDKLSKGLETVYNSAAGISSRTKRATAGTEAKIYNITRESQPSINTIVLYSIVRNGRTVSAVDAVQIYDQINTLEQLSLIIGYKVTARPITFIRPTPPPQNVTVFMILAKTSRNLTIPAYRKGLEENMASYYKIKTKKTDVTTTIFHVSTERTGNTFVKFYVTADGQQVLAETVVEVFKVTHLVELTAVLKEPVVIGPYITGSVSVKPSDYSVLRLAVPAGINLQEEKEKRDLEDKIATIYVTGKSKNARRRKRAVGSVSAKVVNVTAVGDSNQYSDVTFYVVDSGKVANSSYVTTTMNKLNTNEMTLITSPLAVTQPPRPVAAPVVTDAPPVTVAPVVIPYWIIGAVLGPICLCIIIILLIFWRWKSGAPGKIQSTQQKPQILHKPMEPPKSFETPRYIEGKHPPSKIKTMSENVDVSYEQLPRRETSLRRKVAKTPYKRTSMANAGYEESEEDDDITDVSRTGSRERIIKAQPGPGMKDKISISAPVKQPPKIRTSLEEESEEGLSESESESESIASTTQTSAAQVPTVAVMAGSSGHEPKAPVRFRSSVHPTSSLPPLQSKPLVAAQEEEETEDDTPRKSKRRSKVAQQELKQKADMERLRNKKRQRERKNKIAPAQTADRRAWHRDRLDQVLDPQPENLFGKAGRKKKRKGRKGTLATDEEGIELKSYRRSKDLDETETQDKEEEDSEASSDDSTISMEETRRRMHNLLDDAFSLLGPLSKQQQVQRTTPQSMALTRPPAPPRYAGSRPALPEPAPAHGRATEPTPRQKRRLVNTTGFPHGLRQTPIGPGYPIRPPVRPPLVTSDPVVVWDPYDRKRYMDPRMGYQPTYSYRDPDGQNVYITPVQQQRDYVGAPLWSPYAAEDTMEEIYPDLSKASFPGAFDTSPSKDTFNPDFTSRDTTIDLTGGDLVGQRTVPLGNSPQPLIRSIKEELLRLSGPRRTPITEI